MSSGEARRRSLQKKRPGTLAWITDATWQSRSRTVLQRFAASVTAGRTREIAVRRALGARGARIVALVVRDSLAWTVARLAAGLSGAFAMSRYLEWLLFGIGARDSITFLGSAYCLPRSPSQPP